MQTLLHVALIAMAAVTLAAQTQTVGTFVTDSSRMAMGYTLFAPITSTTTYLIDHAGQVVHSWPSSYRPGQAAMLLADGSLLVAGYSSGPGRAGQDAFLARFTAPSWSEASTRFTRREVP